jgi:biopolymer transport protein TolR
VAFNTGKGSDDDLQSEINIIPLVDVMLVLLIIFMVAAPMMNDTIDVSLPKAKAEASESSQESVILSINKDEEIFLGKTPIKREEVTQRLKTLYANRERKEIFVNADERITHGTIIKLMADIRSAGVFRISFYTDPAAR